ncbi:MAG TPA: magnesium/cobalt transporter CorA [Ktedonobacteraceae bacterium]|nr:magnesium/cobalt transporter CorA [Ktedonobacteraceae bacterium]
MADIDHVEQQLAHTPSVFHTRDRAKQPGPLDSSRNGENPVPHHDQQGTQAAGESIMRSVYCNTRDHTFAELTNLDQIAELIDDPGHILWLDMQRPTEQGLATIARAFRLHPLAIEDASHEHQRPKVEEYENFFFLVFHTVHLDTVEDELNTREIDIFVGKNYLITVHDGPIQELSEAERRWKRNNMQAERGIGLVLYSLLDTLVDQYFPVVDTLVDQAEALEARLFAGTATARERQLTLDLLALKKQFLSFRRIATPERDVLNVLTNRDNPLFTEEVTVYFRDVYDHITRLTDTLDQYRDQLITIMNANVAIVSNELNKVMRTLTAASIILMFDALVVGIYGMNFVNMPELHWQYGYYMVLAFMATVSVGLFFVFKRVRWI